MNRECICLMKSGHPLVDQHSKQCDEYQELLKLKEANCPEKPDSWEGVTWQQAKTMYDAKCEQLTKLKAAIKALEPNNEYFGHGEEVCRDCENLYSHDDWCPVTKLRELLEELDNE